MTAGLAALIAVGVVAALLIAGLAVYGAIRFVGVEQSNIGLACSGSADRAGSPVTLGDSLCGYKLGATLVAGSCAGPAIPDGLTAWQKGRSDAQATTYAMAVDSEGCDLDAPVGTIVWLDTANSEPPDIVVVVDFIPHTDWGMIGINFACNHVTCVEFFIDPAGAYRLDEKRGTGDWTTLSRGALPLFTISHLGTLNRMVVRYHERSVQAFLNGYAVVRATTTLLHSSGIASVFSDDSIGVEAARLHVRTLDVFEST